MTKRRTVSWADDPYESFSSTATTDTSGDSNLSTENPRIDQRITTISATSSTRKSADGMKLSGEHIPGLTTHSKERTDELYSSSSFSVHKTSEKILNAHDACIDDSQERALIAENEKLNADIARAAEQIQTHLRAERITNKQNKADSNKSSRPDKNIVPSPRTCPARSEEGVLVVSAETGEDDIPSGSRAVREVQACFDVERAQLLSEIHNLKLLVPNVASSTSRSHNQQPQSSQHERQGALTTNVVSAMCKRQTGESAGLRRQLETARTEVCAAVEFSHEEVRRARQSEDEVKRVLSVTRTALRDLERKNEADAVETSHLNGQLKRWKDEAQSTHKLMEAESRTLRRQANDAELERAAVVKTLESHQQQWATREKRAHEQTQAMHKRQEQLGAELERAHCAMKQQDAALQASLLDSENLRQAGTERAERAKRLHARISDLEGEREVWLQRLQEATEHLRSAEAQSLASTRAVAVAQEAHGIALTVVEAKASALTADLEATKHDCSLMRQRVEDSKRHASELTLQLQVKTSALVEAQQIAAEAQGLHGEVSSLHVQLKQATEHAAQLRGKVEKVSSELSTANAQVSALSVHYAELSAKCQALATKLHSAKQQTKDAQKQSEHTAQELQVVRNDLDATVEQLQQTRAQHIHALSRSETIQTQADENQTRTRDAEKTVLELKQLVNEWREKSAQWEECAHSSQRQVAVVEEAKSRADENATYYKEAADQQAEVVSRMEGVIIERDQHVAVLKRQIYDLETAIELQRTRHVESTSQSTHAMQEGNAMRVQLDTARLQLVERQRDVEALQSEVRASGTREAELIERIAEVRACVVAANEAETRANESAAKDQLELGQLRSSVERTRACLAEAEQARDGLRAKLGAATRAAGEGRARAAVSARAAQESQAAVAQVGNELVETCSEKQKLVERVAWLEEELRSAENDNVEMRVQVESVGLQQHAQGRLRSVAVDAAVELAAEEGDAKERRLRTVIDVAQADVKVEKQRADIAVQKANQLRSLVHDLKTQLAQTERWQQQQHGRVRNGSSASRQSVPTLSSSFGGNTGSESRRIGESWGNHVPVGQPESSREREYLQLISDLTGVAEQCTMRVKTLEHDKQQLQLCLKMSESNPNHTTMAIATKGPVRQSPPYQHATNTLTHTDNNNCSTEECKQSRYCKDDNASNSMLHSQLTRLRDEKTQLENQVREQALTIHQLSE